MPETILTLIYIGITIFNTKKLYAHREQLSNGTWLLVQHLMLSFVLVFLVIFDMALRVSKLNSRVYNVDIEVKRTLNEFQDHEWNDEIGPYENLAS